MRAPARAAVAVLAGWAAACGGPPRPNILLITIDTLRADHCSAYGYAKPTTPRLAGLAKEGVLCAVAYAPMATTAPSHATMFTGLLPRAHGVRVNGGVLAGRHQTLAEVLRAHGYRTHAIVSSFVLNRRFGLDQGFESYDDAFPSKGSTSRTQDFEGSVVEGGFDQRASRAREKAVAWLRGAGFLGPGRPTAPFFMWVHFFDPHAPYVPPHRHQQPFAPRDEGDEHESMLASYDGEVHYTDAEIGELVDTLAKVGVLDDTLVVVTGDHGEGLMSHGHPNHGIHLYEEAVRVPLVLRWPRRLPGGGVVGEPVTLADLTPTLLDLLLIDAPSERRRDGLSLARLLRGESRGDPNRSIFLERRKYETARIGEFEVRGEKTALRLGRYKLIEAPDEQSFELYDLEADPDERRNVHADLVSQSQAMSRLLSLWRRQDRRGDAPTDTSAETQEALRALGYVQ